MASERGTSLSFRGSSVFSTAGAPDPSTPHAGVQKLYWLVESRENGEMVIRPLDTKQWLPQGSPRVITSRELQTGGYKPEPELYSETVFPRIQEAVRLSLPDQLPSSSRAAPQPASRAMPQPVHEPIQQEEDEDDPMGDSLRDIFGQAVSLAADGKADAAAARLGALLKQSMHAEKKHRHLFNEFGINLRKSNMAAQSVDFYTRALELAGEDVDENLHFNIARALFEEERYLACTQHLFKALKIAPDNWAVLRFLAWMQEHGLIPKQYLLDVKATLAKGLPDRPGSGGAGQAGSAPAGTGTAGTDAPGAVSVVSDLDLPGPGDPTPVHHALNNLPRHMDGLDDFDLPEGFDLPK